MFTVGVAVVLALTMSAVSTALAGTGVGAVFNLGKTNTVNAVSKLVGSTFGSMLVIDNNGGGPALNLQVEPGKAPLVVGSNAGKATNLDADKLDGKEAADFAPAKAYFREAQGVGRANAFGDATARCDPGDLVISGGYRKVDAASTFVADMVPVKAQPNGWQVIWFSSGTADDITVRVLCADVA